MSDSLRLPPLALALLRAANEGRLHRAGRVYHWHPRPRVLRALATSGITETSTQLHAFGLIDHHEDGSTITLTDRGRAVLAARREGVPVSGNQDQRSGSSSSGNPQNPGRELGKALTDARRKADEHGQTGRRG